MAEITAAMVKELRERTGVGMGKCKEALQEANGDLELAISNLRKAGMASAVKKEGRETKEGTIKTAENSNELAWIEINAETDFVVKNSNFQKFAQDMADEVLKGSSSKIEEFAAQKYSQDNHLTNDEARSLIVQSLGENIQFKRLLRLVKDKNSSYGMYSHMGGKLMTMIEIEGSDQESSIAKEIAMHVAAESPEYLSSDEVPEAIKAKEKEIALAQIQGKPANIADKIVEGKLKAYYDQVCLLNQKFVKDNSMTISELVAERAKATGKPLKLKRFIRWKVGE